MKIVVFGNEHRIGVCSADQIVDVNRAFAQYLREQGQDRAEETASARLPVDLKEFIALGRSAIDDAQRATEFAIAADPSSGLTYQAGAVRIHAPWPGGRIACAGGNYAKHLLGMYRHLPGHENDTIESITTGARESGQWGFWKVPDSVTGPDDDLTFPAHCTYLDYEGEVAIVIGTRGKSVRAGEIERYVWGITLLNDWSKRDRSSGPNRAMSYNSAKNFDGSTSLGPCIVVGELKCQEVEIETRVNGELRQSYNTQEMIWSFGEILEHLSTDFTFVPGDVISGGTNSGTAADSSIPGPDGNKPMDLFLKVGDTVEVSSPMIGAIRNTIGPAA